MNAELNQLSLAEAAAEIAGRRVSPVEVTRACLAAIERLNPTLNAFITVCADEALAAAGAAEAEITSGRHRGPLHGIPIAIKDNVDVGGLRTTAGSAVYAEHVAAADAEVVRRLRAAGAVILGKTNLHEFAFGGSGLISHFGAVRNPWDPARITGGSSSGSAAAVAAGMCLAAIGSDTAGSIRLPAACCGVVGLKPSFGRVSARGVVPLSWSYDHVGPIARRVRDAALLLDVIAGYDADDLEARAWPPQHFAAAAEEDVAPMRVGIARDFFFDALDADVAACLQEALRLVATLVRDVREVAVEVDEDRTVFNAEEFTFHEPLLAAHAGEYQPETLRRIRAGAGVSTSAYIAKRHELEALRRRAAASFREVEAVVTPTVPIPPPRIADFEAHPEQLRPTELLMLRNTRPFNVLGTPTISVPCGFTPEGLPVGLQISAAPGNETAALRLAQAYEQVAGWHERRPPKLVG